jgi:hypothetical protein
MPWNNLSLISTDLVEKPPSDFLRLEANRHRE